MTGTRSGVLTGIMYGGYVTGIITSLSAGKIITYIGSEARVMILSYCLFLLMLTTMLVPGTAILFLLLFPFCGTMFLVHAVATAVVNSRAGDRRGLASGVYVSSYYGGGVLGTYLPGFVFEMYGWPVMTASLLLTGAAGVVLLVLFFRK